MENKQDIIRDLIKQFIYQGYATTEFKKFNKTWSFRTLSPREHDEIVDYINFTFDDDYTKQSKYELIVLSKALLSIDGIEIPDEKKEMLFENMSVLISNQLYDEYYKLEKLQNEALSHEDIIKSFAKPSFDKIKFLVMREAHALPTEQRVKDMNDYQWLWYWYNMQEAKKEEEELEKAKRDYLCMFINPELWKEVREHERNDEPSPSIIGNQKIIYGDTTVDEDFDKKIGLFMKEGEEFTELPGNEKKGDANESLEDFIARVNNNRGYVKEYNNAVQQQRQHNNLDTITPIDE